MRRKSNGKKLQAIRNTYDLSQKEFADKLGVTRASINGYENNVNPVPQSVKRKVLQATGIGFEYFDSKMSLDEAFAKYGIDPQNPIKKPIKRSTCAFKEKQMTQDRIKIKQEIREFVCELETEICEVKQRLDKLHCMKNSAQELCQLELRELADDFLEAYEKRKMAECLNLPIYPARKVFLNISANCRKLAKEFIKEIMYFQWNFGGLDEIYHTVFRRQYSFDISYYELLVKAANYIKKHTESLALNQKSENLETEFLSKRELNTLNLVCEILYKAKDGLCKGDLAREYLKLKNYNYVGGADDIYGRDKMWSFIETRKGKEIDICEANSNEIGGIKKTFKFIKFPNAYKELNTKGLHK